MDKDWKIPTTVCWGQRDKWLSYQGVEEFCKSSGHNLVELPMVQSIISLCAHETSINRKATNINLFLSYYQAGHHVQEDCGEEIGGLISRIISKAALI